MKKPCSEMFCLRNQDITDAKAFFYLFFMSNSGLLSSDIIYSDTNNTLKSGDYYFIGFNPGGEQDRNITLRDAIQNLDRDHSIYLVPYRQHLNSGKLEKLQKRFQKLFEVLDIDPHSVFCTNLIFEASRNISELENISYKINIFWKAHLKFLDIIKPKVIICNGNGSLSSYSYILTLLKDQVETKESKCAGHGNWKIKSCSGDINGKNYLVIGIPHLSYYAPSISSQRKLDAIKFLKDQIHSA